MSSKILLTIIIPTYNSESCLSKNLMHLAKQKCQDFEVIVIDDNSTDQTIKIAHNYKIKTLVKPTNLPRGAAASLNYVLAKVKNPYIALLDSDAYLAENWTEVILKLLPTQVIISAPIFADTENGLVAKLIGLEIESRYENLPQMVGHLSTCNLAINASILKGFKFDEKLLYAYDSQLSFWLRKRNIKFYLTRETFCHHGNKSSYKNYVWQQYQIATHHTTLSKTMPKEALVGSEISPGYLIWQLPLTVLMILSLFFNIYLGLFFFILFLLLNSRFFIYLNKLPRGRADGVFLPDEFVSMGFHPRGKPTGYSTPENKKYSYGLIFPAIFLILSRNVAWIFGFSVGLLRSQNEKKN